MKKTVGILSVALVTVLSLGILAGCGKKEETSNDLLSQIKEKGKIVIAMEGQWAPWTYHDETGALVGYDTEVGKAPIEERYRQIKEILLMQEEYETTRLRG